MSHEVLNQRAVVFLGGLTDTAEILPLRARPLSGDHRVIFLAANWDDPGEPGPDKIARIRAELEAIIGQENKPVNLAGISGGGTLGTCAAHDLEGVDGIATFASPLLPPPKMTWTLKIIDRKFPALRGVMETFVHTVLPGLSPERRDRLMNFRGTRDGKVPPEISVVDGAENHQLLTPRNVFASHSYNIQTALGLPKLRGFLAGAAHG